MAIVATLELLISIGLFLIGQAFIWNGDASNSIPHLLSSGIVMMWAIYIRISEND